MSMIIFKKVSFKYGKHTVFHDFTLEIKTGQITAITGSSGVGKTTLLKLISSFIVPSSGSIKVNDQLPILARESGAIGYLFQSPTLLPWLSVSENIAFALCTGANKLKNNLVNDRVKGAMGLARISHAADKLPQELSGGMKARAALARQLALKPKILLLDEPFSGLDYVTKKALLKEIYQLQVKLKQTIVFVSHDLIDVVSFGDRVLVLSDKYETGARITLDKEMISTTPEARSERDLNHDFLSKVQNSLLAHGATNG